MIQTWSTMMYIHKQRIIFNGDVDFKCPTACQTLINGPTSLRNVYYVIRFLKNMCTPQHAHYPAQIYLNAITKQKAYDLHTYVILPTTAARSQISLLRHRGRLITTQKGEILSNYDRNGYMCCKFTCWNATDKHMIVLSSRKMHWS